MNGNKGFAGRIYKYTVALLWQCAVIMAAMLICAAIMLIYEPTAKMLSGAVVLLLALAGFTGGAVVGKRSDKSGFLAGALAGFNISAAALCIALVFGSGITRMKLVIFAITVFAGAVGGIAGINSK